MSDKPKNPRLFPSQLDMQGEVTLRDWFAGMALQGMLSYPGDEVAGSAHNNSTPKAVASMSYEYADAMLAERESSE